MRVSVIATVRNEESAIGSLLDSLLAQTRLPDEVVLVDGGSTDATRQIALSYRDRGLPLRLLDAPGANISQGRNIAIRAATGDIIASTDAGVTLVPAWLESLLAHLELAGGQVTPPVEAPLPDGGEALAAGVVSGFFQAAPRSVFETALGATTLPDLADIDPLTFLPSSRSVAFTKAAWQEAGGYPEWLDYCEDLVFDLRLRQSGCRFAFEPRALAHFRPRSSLRTFALQYYRYARGDGKADLWRKRHAIRYITYLLLLPALLALTIWHSPFWFLALLMGAAAYLWTPYRRLRPRLAAYGWRDRLHALLLVPLIRVTGDVAKMAGYPAGLLWRARHRDPIAASSPRDPALS
jgi:glycosyltransferase involved in cell wall biosynthesis